MDDREATNTAHLEDPKVGDYWHEMFTPILVVIGRGKDTVTICKTKVLRDGTAEWDASSVRIWTLGEFGKYLSYESQALSHKTWCDVVPESRSVVREQVIQALLGDE